MSDKMLKFVDIGQQTPPKREVSIIEKKILMKFIKNLSMKELVNNQAGALNVEFHFAKYIVH